MISVRVAGGTGAGKRPPFEGRRPEWECLCFDHVGRGLNRSKVNPGYLAACARCGHRRDDGPPAPWAHRGPAR